MKIKKQNMEKAKNLIRKIHEDPKLMDRARKFVAHLGSHA